MEIYFKDSRLLLSAFGEALVRLIAYTTYIFLGAAAFLMFFSDLSFLQWASLLLGFFLFDRLLHAGKGEKTLGELKGKQINVAEAMTPGAYRLLSHAFRKSLMTGQDFHFLLFSDLVRRKDIREALVRLDVPLKEFFDKLHEYGSDALILKEKKNKQELFKSLKSVSLIAYENAVKTGERYIEPRNIFPAVAAGKNVSVTKLLNLFDVSPESISDAIVFSRYATKISRFRYFPNVLGGFAHKPKFLRHRVMNRAWTARPTPTLNQFSTDLTHLAKAERVGFLIGHEKEFESLLRVLSKPDSPNALLLGEPGSGKSTMIAHLAFRIVKDKVPEILFDKRLVSLDIARLVASATPDILSGRMQEIIDEVLIAGNIVLYIPTIHDLFRTADAHSLSAIDLLLPAVKSEAIPIICETYPREFKRFIEKRTDFLEQFEIVHIDEITVDEAVRLLIYQGLILEKQFKVFITLKAIRKSVELAHRYFRSKLLPGSAIDLLKQALAHANQNRLKILDENLILEIAEKQSKIPIQKASGEEAEKLLNLEKIIHKRLVNQDEAVNVVSRALREYRSGLSRRGGPIASFLFVGPTGVGKTELAKILTEIQFSSKDLIQRFDMSEYQDKQSIFRFIGTPDGERTGALTDAILQNPYSLVLLDEFEKAHPDILNLFLQVFDDGRLTDSLGRTASFENTIIIATSNAHSEFIKSEIERGEPILLICENLKKKLTDYFKPELLNRFSGIVAFRNLTQKEIQIITGFLVKEVANLLVETQGIELKVSDDAIGKIAELGYSPVFGARPLRQVISEKIRGVLAEKILKKEIGRGNTLEVSCENGEFEFRVLD